MEISYFDSESFCGYTQITTYFQDFSIADNFGIEAIKDTYNIGFKYVKTNYKYLTEFVMVLNWKCWQHYEKGNKEISELYSHLYYKAKDYAETHLKGEELSYYFRTTD